MPPAPYANRTHEIRPESSRDAPGENGVLGKALVASLLSGIVFLLLAAADSLLSLRGPLTQIGVGLLCLPLVLCGGFRDDMRVALRRGPNPFIVGLALWAVASFALAPYRAPAAADLLRVLAGVAAYFVAAYALPSSRNVVQAATGLVFIGCALALTDFARLGASGGVTAGFQYSFFATHEDVGSLLLLLVPLALAVFVTPDVEEKWRLPAFAATLLLVIALLLARCRAAWIGEIVALLIFFFLRALRRPASSDSANENLGRRRAHGEPRLSGRERTRRLLASPAFLLVVGVVLFVGVSGAAGVFSERAQSAVRSLTDSGENIGTRLEMWNGAARMASEKPVTGWGLGSYLVLQGRWTHLGDDPASVLTNGGTHFNIAHNYYVHFAADAGGVGLFFYIAAAAAVVSALGSGYLHRSATLPPLQTALLLGSASALAGSLVDALGSPSYNFHGVYALWWAIAGLGVASLRPPRRASPSRDNNGAVTALAPTTVGAWAGVISCGLLAATLVLGIGSFLRARGETVPRGTLRLTIVPQEAGATGTPPNPAAPVNVDDVVVVEAVFTDGAGHDLPTAPGTRWRVTGKDEEVALARKSERKVDRTNKQILRRATMTIPKAGVGRMRVEALYVDRYSRAYQAAFP